MSLDLNVPEPGQLVDVRQRRYVVVDVAQSVLPPDLLTSGNCITRCKRNNHLFSLFSVAIDFCVEPDGSRFLSFYRWKVF